MECRKALRVMNQSALRCGRGGEVYSKMGLLVLAISCSHCREINASRPTSVWARRCRRRRMVCAMPCSVGRSRSLSPP